MTNLGNKKRQFWAGTGLFYAAAIWGATFFLVKATLTDIDPVILVGYRFLLAGLLLLVFLFVTKRSPWADFKSGLILAILLWLLYIPQTIGLKYTTASNSGFITGLFVAFVPLFLYLVFRQRPTRLEVTASAVALGGLWILTGGLVDINPGDMLTMVAAVTYALHILFIDKYLKAGADPFVISCQQFLIVGILSLLTGAIFDLPFGVKSAAAIRTVIFLALFPTLSAFIIQVIAQKIVTPLRVSLIFSFEPVFAAMFAWTIGGEDMVLRRALGGLLIVAALAISGLPSRPLGSRRE